MRSYWDLRNLEWKEFGRRLWHQFFEDRVTAQAAQLSFYLVLSIFPLLLFLTALLGFFLESGSLLERSLQDYLRGVAPGSVLELLEKVLSEVSSGAGAGKLSFGLIFSLWAASHGMAAVMEALNIAYGVKEVRVWWKRRGVALLLTVGFLVFTLLSLLLLLAGPKLIDYFGAKFGFSTAGFALWSVLQWVLVLLFLLTVLNSLYYFAPNARHRRWHWLMPGTVVAVLLWLGASYGFKLYLSFSDRYSATYGSIGAVIILLLWLYLTGIAILIGGEVNSELEKRFGNVEEKESPEEQ